MEQGRRSATSKEGRVSEEPNAVMPSVAEVVVTTIAVALFVALVYWLVKVLTRR